MPSEYLKPNASTPRMLRDKRNGQFVNPPLYMTWGGMKNADKLHRGSTKNLALEKGGPTARKKKII